MMENQGALQISFGWLFAIIVGAFIIFLAIFGMTKLFQIESSALDLFFQVAVMSA